jgi:hypothetical protein
MQLEGRAVGEWVSELERTWLSVAETLAPRRLMVDLRGVVHMDSRAVDVLAEMHRRTGSAFLADTPMTKYFAEEARRRGSIGARKGE